MPFLNSEAEIDAHLYVNLWFHCFEQYHVKMTPDRVKWQSKSRDHLTVYIYIYQLHGFPQLQEETDQHLLQGSRSLYFLTRNQFLWYPVFFKGPKLREIMMPLCALRDNRKQDLHNKESTFHINSNSFERIWIRLHLCRILLWNSQMFQLLKHISSFFGIHAEELICHGNNLNFWRAWCCDLQMKNIFFLEKWFTRIPICSNWFHCVIIPRADQIQPHLKEPTRPKGKRSFSEVIFL